MSCRVVNDSERFYVKNNNVDYSLRKVALYLKRNFSIRKNKPSIVLKKTTNHWRRVGLGSTTDGSARLGCVPSRYLSYPLDKTQRQSTPTSLRKNKSF